jgi:hypothetical protein
MASQTVKGARIFTSSLEFLGQHFAPILAICAVPMLLDLLLTALPALLTLFRHGDELREQTGLGFTPLERLAMWLSYPVTMWMSVRIYRYRLKSEFPLTAGEAESFGMSLLYSLAIGVLLLLVFLALAVLTVAVGAGVSALLGITIETSHTDPRALLAALIVGPLAIAAFVYLLYASVRFSVAIPGVALGERPSVLHRMWPMARGIALQLLGWWLLILVLAVVGVFIAALAATALPQAASEVIMEIPLLFAEIVMAVFFAEAYAQLNRAAA